MARAFPLALLPAIVGAAKLAVAAADDTPPLKLTLRSRSSVPGGPAVSPTERAAWDSRRTAVIVCDMWDRHWTGASRPRPASMSWSGR